MEYDLVFEGGGAKGMVFVGAIQEFLEQGHTYDRLLGTSAGAVTAALLAAGYSVEEMLTALSEQENGEPVFAGFMGTPPEFSDEEITEGAMRTLLRNLDVPVIPNYIEDGIDDALARALLGLSKARHLFAFVERGGWYSAHRFVEWMSRKMDEGAFQGQPRSFGRVTLDGLHKATGRDLSLVASDTSAGQMLVLNHRTAPGLPLVWAVRMSMSIPLVWPEVLWRREWGGYRGRNLTGHLVVDGGLLSNFPIELFVSSAAHITAVMGKKHGEDVLGLLIDESKPVAAQTVHNTEPAPTKLDVSQLQVVRRILRLVDTVTGAHDKMVADGLREKVVRLPARGYGTTEFDMSDTRRNALVEAGRQTMKVYLTQKAVADQLRESVSGPDVTVPPAADMTAYADRMATRMLEW